MAVIFFSYRDCFFSVDGPAQYDSDYQTQILPHVEFMKNNILQGNSFLWNPLILCGIPHMANPQMSFFYPLKIIFTVLLPPDISCRVLSLFHIFLASMGILIYLYIITSKLQAALVGSVVFILSGPAMEMVVDGDLDALSTISWLPFLLLFTEKYIQNKKSVYLFLISIACSMSVFAGELQVFSYILIFYLAYIYFSVSKLKDSEKLPTTKSLLISILLGVFLSSVQLLPVIELNALSTRYRSYAISISDSLPLKRSVDLFFPYLVFLKENFVDTAFVLNFGILAFISSIFAFTKDRRVSSIFILMAVFLVLSAFGSPAHLLYYHFFPLGKYVQAGEELIRLFGVMLSVLAGVGWGALQSSMGKIVGLKYILCAVLIMESGVLNQIYQKHVPRYNDRSYLKEEERLIDIIKRDYKQERVVRFKLDEYILSPNVLMQYNISDMAGFYSFVLKKYAEVLTAMDKTLVSGPGGKSITIQVTNINNDSALFSPLLNMLNIKYIFTSQDINSKNFKLLYNDTVKLYKNLNCLPRAFLVDNWRVSHNEADILKNILRQDFNPLQEVYLNEEPVWNTRNTDIVNSHAHSKVEIIDYKPDKIVIEAQTSERKILFVSDTFYPGWKVRIDGKASKIYRANYAFRAVTIDEGRHIVTFYYTPLTFKIGALISVFSLLVIGLRYKYF